MSQHECANLLTVNTQRLNRRSSSADQIPHSFVPFVGYPDSCEFISTKQLGQANRVAPIVLDVVARLARNQ
jgi:hypothetical protein